MPAIRGQQHRRSHWFLMFVLTPSFQQTLDFTPAHPTDGCPLQRPPMSSTIFFRSRLGVMIPIACAVFAVAGCNDDLKQRIVSLEAQAKENAQKITSLTEQQAKSLETIKALENERTAAREKMLSLEKSLSESLARGNESIARENALKEKLSATDKVRETLTQKLSAIEAAQTAADARAAREAAEAAARSNLVLQLGVTMQSGETKPITNAKVYLTKTSLLTLLPGKYDYERRSGDISNTAAGAWGRGIGKFAPLFGQFVPGIVEAVERDAVFQTTTDFNGKASFEGIPPGNYIALCATSLGGGVVLEKTVQVKGKSVFVALDNSDALPDYTK